MFAVVRTLRYVLVDVFTDRHLQGNALAVFTRATGLDTATMAAIAREMNLSETTFILPPQQGGHAHVRIFTPRAEVPFAGHPTLGTAFVLGGPTQAEVLRLETGVGIVPVRLEREGPKITFGWMNQPVPKPIDPPDSQVVLNALGLSDVAAEVVAFDNGLRHVIVTVAEPSTVAALRPDLASLLPLGLWTFAVVARSPSVGGDQCCAKVRVFVPAAGVSEDPATGSAAGPIAVRARALGWLGVGQELSIEQGVEIGRPSRIYANVPEHGEFVQVGGAAVVIGRGELALP